MTDEIEHEPGKWERPKGFVDWNPQYKTRRVLEQVQEILQQYKQYGTMTCRQIFYRLVGQYSYSKTENAYNNLCEYLVRARRAQMIPFGAIRDDGTVAHLVGGLDSVDEWWDDLSDEWKSYGRHRDDGQAQSLELWCEAAGMAPMLARIARPYGVPVYSTGGFSSVTVTREIAVRAARKEKSTVFLHVGDFDPSGESIFDAMSRDAMKFFYQSKHWEAEKYGDRSHLEFLPSRVALTEDQVEEYNLPTAPPKKSDSRSANWVGETCQLEAMAPDDLAHVITSTIEGLFDMDVFTANVNREEEERDAVKQEWDALIDYRSNGVSDDQIREVIDIVELDRNPGIREQMIRQALAFNGGE